MIADLFMSCAECPCFAPIKGRETLPVGECRRNPPTVVIMPGKILDPVTGQPSGKPEVQSTFPVTMKDGHCWEQPNMRALESMMRKSIDASHQAANDGLTKQ